MSWDARMPRPRFSVSGKNRGNKTQVTMTKPITSDIYQGLFPIYHLSKGLGLLPVRFLSQAFGKYIGRIYTIDIIYGVCLLLLFIGAEIYGLHRDLRDGWVNSTRLKHQTALNVTIGDVFAVALLAAVAVAPFRWKYIQEIMTRLSEADEKLSYITPRKTKKFAIILTACALSYLIFISCLDVYSWDRQTKLKRKMPDKGPINYSPIYFLYIQAMMIEIQYTVATYNLNERFLRLNKNLESLLKYSKKMMKTNFHLIRETREQSKLAGYLRSDNETRNVGRAIRTTKISDWITSDGDETRDMVESISQLITVHSSLCDTNILINKAFGLPILVVAITCLLHLIITPYFLMMEANSDREMLFISVQLLWCALHVFRMLMVVQPQLLSTTWDSEICKQLEYFSLQLIHRPLDFSACGLFSLDRGLVTSMAGAVTTYLVILIQFQKADDTKDTSNMLKNATLLLRNVSSLHNSTALRTF
ncbi:hypothetical protein HCN44_004347 [Aphidius gifuensis]|uniref:Gustatory receptor n=1 Tax=Aphidius gifuensis TaxID=684658 RepID=A0A834XWP2_APHGI|nr:hypothetical protein HCN44_004347 [Aphidius gifuensis]